MTAADDGHHRSFRTGAARAILLAFLLAVAPIAVLAKPAACRMVKIAEWTVRFERNLPVIDGAVDGNPVGILIDTGATFSILTHAAAERFGIHTWPLSTHLVGVGGLTTVHGARVTLTLGGAVMPPLAIRVAGERRLAGIDFVLGDDFLRQFDVEFDYARNAIRLFRAEGCRGAHLAYWDRDALSVDLERDDDAIIVMLRVNGRTARTLLDSGAATAGISMRLAEALGLKAGDPRLQPAGCVAGIGRGILPVWAATFDSIAIGEATIRNARLGVSDFFGGFEEHDSPEAILGTDFLRTHRVLASRSQGRLYFSYIGGTVFPPPPVRECRAPSP